MAPRREKLKGQLDVYYFLYIHVYFAIIVDPQANIEGDYGVSVCGRGDDNQTWTDFVRKDEEKNGGVLLIEWHNYMRMCFPYFPNGEFLHLEVIKLQKVGGDPGSSNGVSVIGRARIPVFPTTEGIISVDEPLNGPFEGDESKMTIVGNIKLSFKLDEMPM